MRRTQAPSNSKSLIILALPLALILIVATQASALPGLGGLAKKVKEKATKTTPSEEGTITNDTVVFDDVTLELTGARIERILAVYQSAQAAGAGRPALVEKVQKTQDEQSKLRETSEKAIREAREKRDEVAACRHDALGEIRDRKMQEYSQKALTDPAMLAKFAKIAQQHNAAAAKGDTTAIKTEQDELAAVMMPTHDDTLGVYKKCGTMPPPLPAELRLADLDKETAALLEEIRKVDEKVADAQAEHGDMTREQFAMAVERIQMYIGWRKVKSNSRSNAKGFTSAELDAIEKYLEKLRAALG